MFADRYLVLAQVFIIAFERTVATSERHPYTICGHPVWDTAVGVDLLCTWQKVTSNTYVCTNRNYDRLRWTSKLACGVITVSEPQSRFGHKLTLISSKLFYENGNAPYKLHLRFRDILVVN